jgi:SagB-type dehydrogenase family enzyme
MKPPTSAKQELQRLVEVMSDYECGHVLRVIQDIVVGERFWETEVSTLYNEYVKTRSLSSGSVAPHVIPAGPASDGGIFAPISIVKTYRDAECIQLPAAMRLSAPVTETMLHRRSRRDYTGGEISLEDLSTLLHHTCGTTGFVPGYGYNRLPLRSFPSCGGLQVPEVYMSIQAVEGVPSGLYHYRPVDHVIETIRLGHHGSTIRDLALGQDSVETSAVVFLITGCFQRLRWKYGERAYRYMCMDVGFLGENLYLAGEALGLGVCAIAGFIDDATEQFLEVDGKDEIALLLTTVGVLQNAEKAKAD